MKPFVIWFHSATKLAAKQQEVGMTDSAPARLDLGREFAGRDIRVSNLTAGGACVALGSLGVTATSVLYALSPPAAALPAQPFDQAAALAGAVAGQSIMRMAGTIGIFSDIVMAVGALLVAFELARRGRGLAVAGWVAIVLSIVVFTFVDAIVGFVLGPIAAMRDGAGAFVGFKRLLDALFLLGTMAFGGGAILALMSEMQARAPIASKPLAVMGVLAGLVGVLSAAACFAGFPLEQGVGISIGLGSAIFVAIGAQVMLKPQ
ncbi:hypothetical protein [Bradyrhizobium sp.]|jgi:hypothetical protein|uniref:hypothetical protein n=1 Tax=Bradyrhizobium sp. TaxID=376 RepID=UPI003D0D5CF2